MSLRDFNSPSEDRPIILNSEPIGNGSGLDAFHTTNPQDREPDHTGKIVGALAVALMLGAAGVYAYSVSGKTETKQVVAANTLPAPAAPAPVAAETPPPAPQQDAMTAPSDAAKTADIAPDATVAKPAKVHTARAETPSGASQRLAADTSQPVSTAAPQTAVTAPNPSPNDVASNMTIPAVSPAQQAPDASQQPAEVAPAAQAPAATPDPVQVQAPAAQPAPAPAQ